MKRKIIKLYVEEYQAPPNSSACNLCECEGIYDCEEYCSEENGVYLKIENIEVEGL